MAWRRNRRQRLSDQLALHLKKWSDEFGFTQSSINPDSKLSAQREDLRSRIDIFDVNSTTFHIGFSYSDADTTYRVTRDIYAEVIRSLLELRMHTLANVRDAVRRPVGLSSCSDNPHAVSFAASSFPVEL